MASIQDVADWFLSREAMCLKKVQILCYYYEALGLALCNQDFIYFLPDSEFEACVQGPMNRERYDKYCGRCWQEIPLTSDNSDKFDVIELSVLWSVWSTYGELTEDALEAVVHSEAPCQKARGGIAPFEPITENSMN